MAMPHGARRLVALRLLPQRIRGVLVTIVARPDGPHPEPLVPVLAVGPKVLEPHRATGQKGVAIVLVHHVRKMDADDPLDTVSGTTGLTGAADTVLVLNRTSQGVTLVGRGRDIEEIDVAVSFSRETCRWTAQGPAAEVRRSGERRAILDALQEASEPMAPADIAAATGMPSGNVCYLLFQMMKAGEVEKAGRGRYVHPEPLPNNANNLTGGSEGRAEYGLSDGVNVRGANGALTIENDGEPNE